MISPVGSSGGSVTLVFLIVAGAVILAVFGAAAIAMCRKRRLLKQLQQRNATPDMESGTGTYLKQLATPIVANSALKKSKKKGTDTVQESGAGFTACGIAYGFGTA